MSYGAQVAGITQSYKDDPELRRRIEQMRAQTQGANPAMATPDAAQPQRQIYDIDDPQSPLYGQRHGGSFVTNLVDSAVSGFTLPGQVYRGEVDLNDPAVQDRAADTAGLGMTGGLTAGVPKGGTVLGAGPVRRSEREALLRKLKQDYQSDAPRTDPDKWTYKLADEPAPQLDPVKDLDVNQLNVGDAFVPLVGDLSRVSAPLTQVGKTKFSQPVTMEGGGDFTRGNDAWASNATIPQTIQNKAIAVAEKGGRPIGVTVGMGPQGINYSHHTYEPLIRMTQGSKIKPADVKDFDFQMRVKYPEWPGLKNEDAAIDFLRRQDTTARNPFVNLHQSGEFQNKNFPEGGPVRWAATEPDLRQVIDPATGKRMTGPTGYNFVEIDPNRPVGDSTHSSYTTSVPKKEGGYLGRAPLLPYEQVFRDWAASDRATRFKPAQASNKMYTFRMDQPTQFIDQRLIDDLGKLYESRKKGR